MNTESLNLSIQSHTMTGGTGDPTLVVTQTFSALGEINKFNFQDITLGQQLKTLNNLEDWLKRRVLVAETKGVYITLEKFSK